MDGNENRIVIQVGEFYDFLHGFADAQAHQSGKLADAVIHVHHEIALLKLVKFLERERDFARSGFIGFQVVLVKTVEDLMIGEAADFQRFIGKSFMQCFVYRYKGNIVAPIIEDGAQALMLLLAVAKDI